MDCSLPGSSLHGILQARELERVAVSFSRESSQPRDWTQVSCIPGGRFNIWLARQRSKSFKLGFNNMWTKNFQMYKLDLEKAEEEEPEIKLPTSIAS